MGALFISDLHLGSRRCLAKKVCRFLASHAEHKTIYLVGDVFDDVTTSKWPNEHIEAVGLILSFPTIIYLPGNHDASFRAAIGLDYGRIIVADRIDYLSYGRKYLVTHGDRYDPAMALCVGPRFMRGAVSKITTNFHSNVMSRYVERRAVAHAVTSGYNGVICGHTHHPAQRLVGKVEYINCGDWIRNCTAVIDDGEGPRLEAFGL